MSDSSEYRTESPCLALVRDDRPKAIRRQQARAIIERETHTLVLRLTDGGVPAFLADWFYDLRRKQLRIYGGLLRFIDVSIAKRVPRALLKMIPAWIAQYIDDQYDDAEQVVRKPTAPTSRAA